MKYPHSYLSIPLEGNFLESGKHIINLFSRNPVPHLEQPLLMDIVGHCPLHRVSHHKDDLHGGVDASETFGCVGSDEILGRLFKDHLVRSDLGELAEVPQVALVSVLVKVVYLAGRSPKIWLK